MFKKNLFASQVSQRHSRYFGADNQLIIRVKNLTILLRFEFGTSPIGRRGMFNRDKSGRI